MIRSILTILINWKDYTIIKTIPRLNLRLGLLNPNKAILNLLLKMLKINEIP